MCSEFSYLLKSEKRGTKAKILPRDAINCGPSFYNTLPTYDSTLLGFERLKETTEAYGSNNLCVLSIGLSVARSKVSSPLSFD